MLTLFGMLTNVVMATSHIAEIDGINYVIYYLGGDHVNYAVVTGVSCPGAIIIPERITHRDIYDGNESTLSVRVTSISEGAFKNHNDITSVIIGGNVSKINYEAFRGCTGLTSITIPNSVYTIGNYAFEGCSSLTSVTIPNSVTSIGIEAFSGCSGLSSIVVDDGNTKYDSRNNCNAIIESSANKLIAGSNNTVIPNTISSIDTKAFSGRSGLASVTIPNSVTSIGTQAFSGCSGLSSIVVDDGNTKYDSRNNCNAIIETESNCLITGCQNTTIPNSVTRIGGYAFEGCSSLTSITIPNSVTSIVYSAFEGCSSLTSISIPNSVTSIGNSAFNNTGWYNNQSDGLLYLDNWLIGYKGSKPTGKIIIKGGTKKIGTQALSYCSSLTSITIPNSVTSIGWGAFEGCSSLTSVTIPNSVASIEGYAFYGCSSLSSVTIPNSVTSIGYNAFYGCSSLISVTIPNSVTSIGSDAFYGCYFLINNFINNSSLTSSDTWGATLCDEETSDGLMLKSNSIIYCRPWATTVTIPNSVTSIGNYSFKNCSGLTSVKVDISSPLPINYYTFYGNQANATLYVPEGCKSAYESANYWKEFKEIVEMGTDISKLDNAIYVAPFTVRVGDNKQMDSCLKNAEAATAYVFDLVLPEGITVAKNSNGKYIEELSDRHDDHTRTFNYKGDNTYSLSTLSGNSEQLTGNDGPIRLVTIAASDNMAEGNYAIDIKNASYSKPDGTLVSLPNTRVLIKVEDYVLGDVNGNGRVDIGDAVSIVNYLVGKESSIFVAKAADTNKNGQIDIGDAVTIVNLLVGKITHFTREFNIIWDEKEPE